MVSEHRLHGNVSILLSVTQNPFTVYVEAISANDRCVDICIDPQWVVKCNFDDDFSQGAMEGRNSGGSGAQPSC